MDQHCIVPMSKLIIIAALLRLCSCSTVQGSILRSLTTNKPQYLEHETAMITASFMFPTNKSMSDYIFKWSVGHPDGETPFIEETRFIYKHRKIGDVDRFEISLKNHSSSRGSVKIVIHDLRLEDHREIKLSVFVRDSKVEILHEFIKIRVDPQEATTSSKQVRGNVSPETESDATASTLPPSSTTTTPLGNTKMWIPLGLIFFLILLLIFLKFYNYVNQPSNTCTCIREDATLENSSATSTSKSIQTLPFQAFIKSTVRGNCFKT